MAAFVCKVIVPPEGIDPPLDVVTALVAPIVKGVAPLLTMVMALRQCTLAICTAVVVMENGALEKFVVGGLMHPSA